MQADGSNAAGHVQLVTISTTPLSVCLGHDSVPIPGPIYQKVGELPQIRIPVNKNDIQGNCIIESCETPVQATASDSTDIAPHPLYEELTSAIQDGVPSDSNLSTESTDLHTYTSLLTSTHTPPNTYATITCQSARVLRN